MTIIIDLEPELAEKFMTIARAEGISVKNLADNAIRALIWQESMNQRKLSSDSDLTREQRNRRNAPYR